jgi:diguanylate cyclase (GGDEF)-like protein
LSVVSLNTGWLATHWKKVLVLMLLYVAGGYLGICVAAFPGTFFAQVWLPSGIGLVMFCLFGRRALFLVALASLLVNGPFALQHLDKNGAVTTGILIVFSPALDALQSFLAWRFWRLDREPRLSRLGLQRFLSAILLAVSVSILLMANLHLFLGLIEPNEFIARFAMMALADLQGLFLIIPLWLALRRAAYDVLSYPLFFSALAIPVPLLLASLEPTLAALLFPLIAFIIIRLRFIGAALALFVAGGCVVVLVATGNDPLQMGQGVEAFSGWALIVLALGTPMLLMGIVLDDSHDYQMHLEARVSERTQALQDALAAAHTLAITDSLTRAFNRRQMETLVHDEVERAQRYQQPMSLIILDIDHFKKVNDNYGHPVGDKVLQKVSEILAGSLRQSDSLGRWGGEEFLILLPQIHLGAAASVAEKLRLAVYATNFELKTPVTISLGVAELRDDESAGDWITRADQALYMAKDRGRNQLAIAD